MNTRRRHITVVVVALIGSLLQAAPARAYQDCTFVPGGSASDVDTLRIDTGEGNDVDFGDDWHVGGAPQGNALICWGTNGTVAFKGKVFADSGAWATEVGYEVCYHNYGCTGDRTLFWGNWAASREVSHGTRCCVNRLTLRLYAQGDVKYSVTRSRGD